MIEIIALLALGSVIGWVVFDSLYWGRIKDLESRVDRFEQEVITHSKTLQELQTDDVSDDKYARGVSLSVARLTKSLHHVESRLAEIEKHK